MNEKENILKAIRFEYPEHIPVQFVINDACWQAYDQHELMDLIESHNLLFPEFTRPEIPFIPDYLPNARAYESYTDPWGCVWETRENGIIGTVTRHSLPVTGTFNDWKRKHHPDPEKTDGIYPIDWKVKKLLTNQLRTANQPVICSLPHGHTFLRLQDIRGYEQLIFDMADNSPVLLELIDFVESFNLQVLDHFLELSPDIMCLPEDLGMQIGPMISPDYFEQYIAPSYRKYVAKIKESQVITHMHSDGDIRVLVDQLVTDGIEVINLQDKVNGIEWIASRLSGKVCIELDIDRQHSITSSPREIDEYIQHITKVLGRPSGGLMLIYGLYPQVSIQTVGALMDALERYAF